MWVLSFCSEGLNSALDVENTEEGSGLRFDKGFPVGLVCFYRLADAIENSIDDRVVGVVDDVYLVRAHVAGCEVMDFLGWNLVIWCCFSRGIDILVVYGLIRNTNGLGKLGI
mmetsp:Transcript_12871/g.19293  ORF Transcript_12871/g.19293 Transcript_12871/m.19293 type:complete len:112 (-) Transcript_12871:5-340(-)